MSESHKHRRSTLTAESFIGTSAVWSLNTPLTPSVHSDHKPFLSDRFDVHDYANAVLQGRAYLPDEEEDSPVHANRQQEKGDLGVEVARLNYGIVS